MKEILFVAAAVWGLSGAVTVIMFTLDERAHRRAARPVPLHEQPVRMPAMNMGRRATGHVDRALV